MRHVGWHDESRSRTERFDPIANGYVEHFGQPDVGLLARVMVQRRDSAAIEFAVRKRRTRTNDGRCQTSGYR